MPLPPDPLPELVADALKALLSKKQIYQRHDVDTSSLDEDEKGQTDLELYLSDWLLIPNSESVNTDGKRVPIKNIDTYCHVCKDNKPCAPTVTRSIPRISDPPPYPEASPVKQQTFVLTFKCQGCQEGQIDFYVCRVGPELRIAGRWPMGVIKAPNVIPQNFRDFYSKAMITLGGGFELAGAMYLRVLIEQFWKSRNLIEKDRPSGDEMGSAYNKTLPADFVNRFPNLLAIYNDLSGPIHTGRIDETLVIAKAEEIVNHFDARRLFKLP